MSQVLMTLDAPYADREAKGESGDVSADLVARLRGGDVAALGEAYDRHQAHVRAFARRFVGDDASAEDIVQETFVGLPGAIRGFRGTAPFRTFLIGVALNHARHHVRAAARRRSATDRLASEPPPPRGAGPERELQEAELARALARAPDELSLDHRATFVLCELEERTSVEASVILGVPEATVRTRLLHAKKQLRVWFERRGVR